MWTKSTWQSLPASTYVFLNSLLDLDIQESAESLLLWCRTLPQIFFHSASMLSFLYAKRVLKTQHLHQRPNKQILNSSQVSSQTSEESDREPLNVFVPAQWNASLSQKKRWTKEHGFKHRWTLANFKNPTNNLERVVNAVDLINKFVHEALGMKSKFFSYKAPTIPWRWNMIYVWKEMRGGWSRK